MSGLSSSDLHGILAMMPAFTTDGATSYQATDTIDVSRLKTGVDKIIKDGVNVIATTGSFGEGYNLLPDEYRTLVEATVAAVGGRVPLLAGCVGSNAREILARAHYVRGSGADAVLLGLPNYFPISVVNALRYYREAAESLAPFPVLIYHNPVLHRTRLPAACFDKLMESKNIIGLKDSHRDTRGLLELMEVTSRRLRLFCFAGQYHAYSALGAAGAWSIECWMGPAPLTALRDAVASGDNQRAIDITRAITDVQEGQAPPDLRWREVGDKIAIRYAGYCDPGPLRAPYIEVPEDVDAHARSRAAYWCTLQERYAKSPVAA